MTMPRVWILPLTERQGHIASARTAMSYLASDREPEIVDRATQIIVLLDEIQGLADADRDIRYKKGW
jgi:hypothetical protein